MRYFSFQCYGHLRHLHSFPTRRSSDLACASAGGHERGWRCKQSFSKSAAIPSPKRTVRSEEHTSELQSRFDIVCRLLLEKKKAFRATVWSRLTITDK